MTSHTKSLRLVASVAVFTLAVVAACGGDDTSDSSDTSGGKTSDDTSSSSSSDTSGSSSSGSSGDCPTSCKALLPTHCTQGPKDQADCEVGCESVRSGKCSDLYDALFDCAGPHPEYFCYTDGRVHVKGCNEENDALWKCLMGG